MKISIFYFSGTGNTWWVSQEFGKIATERNHVVKLYNIEHADDFDIKTVVLDSDILGIAYPIYGSTYPNIMKSFLEELVKASDSIPTDQKPPYFVLTSMMIFSGDGAVMPDKYLKNGNFALRWALNIPISSNISVPGFRMNPAPENRVKKRKIKAKKNLENFLNKMEKNKKSIQIQWFFLGRFLGWTQRVFLKRAVDAVLNYSVDTDICIKCLKCVKECPVENILYDEISEEFTFLDKCIWCMRCYNFCPTQAVLIKNQYCDPKKFRRLKPISTEYKIK